VLKGQTAFGKSQGRRWDYLFLLSVNFKNAIHP
jgi:hypothetical protein